MMHTKQCLYCGKPFTTTTLACGCPESQLTVTYLPPTDFTRTIPVTVYDAKQFIGRIETQIEILETLNKPDEAKHWRDINGQAHKLFGIPYNLTSPLTQKFIEENGKV